MNKQLIVTGLLVVFMIAGCIPDKCESINCINGGVCVQGDCACAYGYEGEFCQDTWLQKFTGSWNVTETGKKDTVLNTYPVTVAVDTAIDTFVINGFADSINGIKCGRTAYRMFAITRKDIDTVNKIAVEGGEGTLSEDGLKVTGMYSFKRGDTITTHNFTWSR